MVEEGALEERPVLDHERVLLARKRLFKGGQDVVVAHDLGVQDHQGLAGLEEGHRGVWVDTRGLGSLLHPLQGTGVGRLERADQNRCRADRGEADLEHRVCEDRPLLAERNHLAPLGAILLQKDADQLVVDLIVVLGGLGLQGRAPALQGRRSTAAE